MEFSQRMKLLGDRATTYLEMKGYVVSQHNGQRVSIKVGEREPSDITERLEVFVGKIPREMFEDGLLPILERAGKVFKIRLMMDFSGTNRGFGFVKYMHQHEASRACELLNKSVLKPNTAPIGVLPSKDNKRLYVGNLPLKCTKEGLLKELINTADGVEDIELPELPRNNSSGTRIDRRFAFVTFKSHDAATQARRVLVPGTVKMFDRILTVDWAKPDRSQFDRSSSPKQTLTGLTLGTRHQIPLVPLTRLNGSSIDLNNNLNTSSIKNTNNTIANNSNNCNINNIIARNRYNRNIINPFDLAAPAFQQQTLPQPQLQSLAAAILGDKTWRMLESCLPNASTYQRTNIITICNVNLTNVTKDQLKRIFELTGKLNIIRIQATGPSSVEVAYQTTEQAELMLEALIMAPRCFEQLALHNSLLSAYAGSTSSTYSA